MKLYAMAATAAFSLAVSSTALAAEVNATLQAPVAKRTTVISGGGLFVCVDNRCTASDAPSRAETVSGCKELVKEVGAVSTFGEGTKSLNTELLARCNAAAKTASR